MCFFVNIFAYIGNFSYLCGKFRDSMILWILIIGAIIWTIDLTWRTYRNTGSIGFSFIVLLFCIGASPLVAYLFVGRYLYD